MIEPVAVTLAAGRNTRLPRNYPVNLPLRPVDPQSFESEYVWPSTQWTIYGWPSGGVYQLLGIRQPQKQNKSSCTLSAYT